MNEQPDFRAALAAPFPPNVIGWKAQTTRGNRALAVAYIDARDVMNRLDDVVGLANWKDEYTPLPDGSVMCVLSLRLDGEWISKSDVGGESEQKDEGDRRKAAFSDSLKRAAIKWGVGRYLYGLDPQWVDYDPQEKKLVGKPKLKAEAMPAPVVAPKPAIKDDPKTGQEFHDWLDNSAATAYAAGWISNVTDLSAHVQTRAAKEGWPESCLHWTAEQVTAAVDWARKYAQDQRSLKTKRKAKNPEPVGV